MKFGQPLLTSELSGALGGVVAASARGGTNYFRVRRRPGNPRTSFQSRVRLIMASLAGAWASVLTDAQRANWEAIAPENASGIDTYIKSNAQILLGSETRVDDPPASLSLSVNPMTTVAIDASADTLTFVNSSIAADLHVNVYAQLFPQRASQLSQNGHTTWIDVKSLAAAGTNTVNLATIPGLSGAVAGDIVYVRFVQFDETGRVAVEQIERVTVVA